MRTPFAPARRIGSCHAKGRPTSDTVETKHLRNEIACLTPAAGYRNNAPHDSESWAYDAAARRRGQGDHRAAATRRPTFVRRHRQGGRPLRGRGAPPGTATDRV